MTDEEKKEEKPKRVNRFIYSDDDIAHIFRLGDIGGVFKTEKSTLKLESILNNVKKIKKIE